MKYKVNARIRLEIREIVNKIRDGLNYSNELYFPIEEAFDILVINLPDFSYEVVDDEELGDNIHAETNIETGHIKIKESIFNSSCAGSGRDRMTLAHELGHFFLHYYFNNKIEEVPSVENAYIDPEWQAKCFAGELLIPKNLVMDLSCSEIKEKCGVSMDAARYQKGTYLNEK